MRGRLSHVAMSSIRVALVTAAIVAVAYVVVAVSVVAIVQHELTGQVDDELAETLDHLPAGQHEPPPGGYHDPPPMPGDHRFGPPRLIFTVSTDGTVRSNNPQAVLPEGYHHITSPETITIGNTTMRAMGRQIGGAHVVVATSMEDVLQTRLTLIVAETIVGPLLLIIVFLGALLIGQRVAAPVEAARRRQLDFTADASHELRTPLSVIEATTSLALRGERPPEWYQRAFTNVYGESRRMRRLVEDLLWLARFDATERQQHPESVDLGVLAAEAVDRFGARAEARRLRLELERGPGRSVVTAPPEWLDRLLGVLLDNACKYAPEGGEVRVRLRVEGNRLELVVDDSGPGIPEAERAHIFDRFHRATGGAPGAGLGLAMADAVVRATGGRWRVGTSPQGGASMGVAWHRG